MMALRWTIPTRTTRNALMINKRGRFLSCSSRLVRRRPRCRWCWRGRRMKSAGCWRRGPLGEAGGAAQLLRCSCGGEARAAQRRSRSAKVAKVAVVRRGVERQAARGRRRRAAGAIRERERGTRRLTERVSLTTVVSGVLRTRAFCCRLASSGGEAVRSSDLRWPTTARAAIKRG